MLDRRLRASCLLLLGFLPAFAAGEPVVVTVMVQEKPTVAFTAADLAALPRVTAGLERDGEKVGYEAVLLYDLLLKVYDLPAGKPLPLNVKASYIRGTCRDGYTVVFGLAEIAPMFAGARVVLANKRVHGPLQPYQQPSQLIAPQDKVHGPSAFSLMKLEVVELQR